ncbi:hypothetical protein GCM10027269_03950 [Kribbella endophytica]
MGSWHLYAIAGPDRAGDYRGLAVVDDREMPSGMSDLEKLSKDVASAVSAAVPLIEAVGRNATALARQIERDHRPELEGLRQRADQALQVPEGTQADVLRGAMQDADGIGGRLRRAGGEVGGLAQDLEQAGKHLRAGAKSRAELVDVLGVETPEIKELGKRLTDLSGAVEAAGKTLAGSRGSVDGALGSVRQLLNSDLRADRQGTASKIRTAHTGLREGFDGVGEALSKASTTLTAVDKVRDEATKETKALEQAGQDGTLAKAGADATLAKAAQAAANPTPKSQQVTPGSASPTHAATRGPDSPTQERNR